MLFVTAGLPDTIFSIYELNKIGAIPVMVEPRMARDRIEHFIRKSKPKLVVVVDLAFEKVKDMIAANGVKTVLVQSGSDSLPSFKRVR